MITLTVSTQERLRQIMSERNLKQRDILEMSLPYQKKFNIKMGKSALSQYVNGKSSPDQHKLYLLGATLNVNEAWLMGFDVPMKRTVEMNIFDRILYLANKQGVSISKVATDLEFSEKLFHQWKKNNFESDQLKKVADYFGVSTDYLSGRTDNPDFSKKEIEFAESLHDLIMNEDQEALDLFNQIIQLNTEERKAVKKIIDGILQLKKLEVN